MLSMLSSQKDLRRYAIDIIGTGGDGVYSKYFHYGRHRNICAGIPVIKAGNRATSSIVRCR